MRSMIPCTRLTDKFLIWTFRIGAYVFDRIFILAVAVVVRLHLNKQKRLV